MAVVFDVSKSLYSLRDQPATSLAEDLRRTAAGQLGKYGVEGARAVADAIEQALVGATDDPIPLAGDEAEAVFYKLNVGFNRTDPAQTEERALYRAVRELHEERPREG
jgi:hypothetical protein